MIKIFFLFNTIYSLIRIYLQTIFSKNKKFLIFYFPVKAYQENIIELINAIKDKKLKIILTFNKSTSNEIKKYQNSFFLDLGYLSYIPFKNFFLKNINFFLSSYLTYIYPPYSKNIYISHDIYDAPMINKKLEKKMFIRINKIDYIFAGSEVSKKYLYNQLKKYNKNIKPKIFNTGYLKLDHVFNKNKLVNKKKNKSYGKNILIAPAYSYNYRTYNISKILINLIDYLIYDQKKIIIYRPHPLDLTNKGDINMVEKIMDKFKNNKNFKLDRNVSYLKSYKESDFLLTDITSIAYTYAFSSEKPVIFYSPKEKLIKKDRFLNIHYINDRPGIGIICKNFNEIKNAINKFTKKRIFYKKKIITMRKKRIKFFNNAKIETRKTLLSITSNNEFKS